MKLYFAPGACALGPQIVLREAGLPFEMVRVNLKSHTLAETGADYYAVNPKGSVPALQLDEGYVLTEGPAIYQWIADQKPNAGLAPANGTLARTQLQEMLNFITSELHKGVGLLFNPDMPAEFKGKWKDKLVGKFALMDARLAQQPYLMGETFSVADAYLFNITRWTAYEAIQVEVSHLQNLAAFMERMRARPAVQAALQAEGLA